MCGWMSTPRNAGLFTYWQCTLGTFLRCPGYGSSFRQEDWGGPDSIACEWGCGTGTSGESVQLHLLIVSPRGEVGGTGWAPVQVAPGAPRAAGHFSA